MKDFHGFPGLFEEELCRIIYHLRAPGHIALPVAGDRAEDKHMLMRLIDEIGFDPVDAGGLDESWRQQPATPVHATDFDAAGVRRALAEANSERKPEWRATPASPGTFANPA